METGAERLLAHEIAHTWFGDIITCKEWSHIWLNEGFATYFQALYKEHSRGWNEFIYDMLQKSDSYFEESKNYKKGNSYESLCYTYRTLLIGIPMKKVH